ncbi:MAG: hypothetical protein IT289_09905 [Oligoflexia bacterium]|nr:hypothetical protein [Oligoflexia bacterium]
MKRFAAFLIPILMAIGTHAEATQTIASFGTWKTQKVRDAKARVQELQKLLKRYAPHLDQANEEAVENLKRLLWQAEINLKLSQDLTAHDYLVLYAFPKARGDKSVLKKAAKSLNSDDVVVLFEQLQKKTTAPELMQPTGELHEAGIVTGNPSATPQL